MTAGTDADPLFEAVQVGPVTLRNRVFVPAHTTNFAEADRNLVTPRHVAYHRARAAGGVGLIITEGLRVHRTSLRRYGLGLYDDAAIPGLERLAAAVHPLGAAIFGQLLHTGRHDSHERTGAWAPSAIPWTIGAAVPHAMSLADIQELIDSYRSATRRLNAAHFDGVEVHLGHGHLLQQFLSPLTNRRTDRFGTTKSGRLEVPVRALAAVRDELDTGRAFGIRVSADEFEPGGLGLEDMLEIVQAIVSQVDVDFIHVSHSAYVGAYSISTQMADMSFPPIPFRAFPAAFKRAFPDTKILAVCRVDDLRTGAQLVEERHADLVGLARPHIADPSIVEKWRSGEAQLVRSCIACNQGCVGNLEAGLPITCVVNPEAGREREWATVKKGRRSHRDVLVVGGGPAGLELAVTAAKFGHAVTLVESRKYLGGQLALARTLDSRTRIGLLVDELAAEVHRHRVRSLLGTEMTTRDMVAGPWQVIVIAAGSEEMPGKLAGYGLMRPLASVRTPESLGRHIVLFDDVGGWPSVTVAEQLALQGRFVEIVTSIAAFAPGISTYSRVGVQTRLGKLGVRIRPLTRLVRMETDGELIVEHTVNGDQERLVGVSAVIHAAPRKANDRLAEMLDSASYPGEVHIIGDAFAPRTALEAVYEGRLVATTIGRAAHPDLHKLGYRRAHRAPTTAMP